MSDTLQEYIRRLESQAKPDTNDGRHDQYVKFTNIYSEYFGNDKAFLVGSTTEGLKLRSRHQGGDADFILRSGKLEIPFDCLEHREATPCYVRIKGDRLPEEFRDNIINGYLSADLVRHVNPKLFTTLRAIFSIVTTPSDSVPGRESRVTQIVMPMKVGTGKKELRNLEIEGIDTPEFRSKRRRLNETRSNRIAARLRRRWSETQRRNSDMAYLTRILNIFTDLQVPGSNGRMFGQLNNFATLLRTVLMRPSLDANADEDQENVEFNNDLDEEDTERTYKGTYTDMTSKDFVPALKVVCDRKPEFMKAWYERVTKESWPPKDVAKEIFDSELLVVARDAPIDPDHDLDFCLSFNVSEMKLSRCLTADQRRVYLILKSYLNGTLKKKHEEMQIEMKLKTYYLKTALFWVCEKENVSTWASGNILTAVTKVLDYLLRCLSEKKLSHYFVVDNNLFAEMNDIDFDVLQECIREIKMNPVYSIEEFFQQDSKSRAEIWLNEEEVRCIQQMRDDGGDEEAMDRLEDAIIDLQRGFNESRRDANGNIPIRQAVLALLDKFFDDERTREAESATSNMSLGGVASNIRVGGASNSASNSPMLGLFSGLIGNLVTSGGTQPADSQRVGQVTDFLHTLSQFSPEASQHVANLGGRSGIEAVVAQQGTDKETQRRQMRNVTDKYLSCSEEEVESVRMELKHIFAGYFIGRPE